VTTLLVSLLTLTLGAFVSGIVTYVGTRRKLALDYDADLRKRRINAYAKLWTLLEPLAKYSSPSSPSSPSSFSRHDATRLVAQLQFWYFHEGGLFLSSATRTEYMTLQDLLARLNDTSWGRVPGSDVLTDATREHVRLSGSRLRTSLTRDIGTRSRPKLRGDVDPIDPELAGVYERGDGRRLKLAFAPRLLGGTRRLSVRADREGDGHKEPSRKVARVRWNRERLAIEARLDDGHEHVLLYESRALVDAPVADEQVEAGEPSMQPARWRRLAG
jgi:hypothetical protein